MTDEKLLSETSLNLLKPLVPVQVLPRAGGSLLGAVGLFLGCYELPKKTEMHSPGLDNAGLLPVPTDIYLQQRCSTDLEHTQTWS